MHNIDLDIDCTHHLCDMCGQHIPADKWMPDANGHSHHYGYLIWAKWSNYRKEFIRTDCRTMMIPGRDNLFVMVARWMLGKSRDDSLKQYRNILLNKQY